jgi:ribonuclease Z
MRPGKFHPERALKQGIPKGELWKELQDGNDIKINGITIKSSDIVDSPRPGRKIIYTGDTRPNDSLIELARTADLLIHEATFDDDLIERAAEDGHSTFIQAARVASIADVKQLIITHISSRYSDTDPILKSITSIFSESKIAHDLMEIEVQST